MEDPVWKRRSNRVKKLLARGEPVLAVWVTIPWPSVVEIAGAWGVDAAIIDLEHTSMGLESLEHMLVAAQLAGVTSIVRPPNLEPTAVGRILDIGAEGILFPRVEDGDDAETARRSLRHAPVGRRGWGGAHTRHALWQGSSVIDGELPADRGVYSEEYVNKAASDVASVFLVESVRGVESIEDILDRGQPDMVDFGRGDFSVEVGFDNDACDEAFDKVFRACRARNIGMNIAPSQIASRYYPGCYSVIGMDALLLSRALQQCATEARDALVSRARVGSNRRPRGSPRDDSSPGA